MKQLLILSIILFSMTTFASIDADSMKGVDATEKELGNYRACFQELARHGCGHPSEDMGQFSTCLSSTYPSLTSECQKMMKTLYGK